MGFMDKIKNLVNGEEYDDDFDDFDSQSQPQPQPRRKDADESTGNITDFRKTQNNRVVNINATTQLSVVLVKPEKYENASEIADHLRQKRTVVLNLEQTNKDIARRLVDFLSGVAYAQDGKIQKIANSTFIITPFNVDIMGEWLDELENNGVYI